jgi:hypothetical protein
MKDDRDPVSDDERVLRRIHNRFFDRSLPQPVQHAAFRPTDHDFEGISVFRQECGVIPEQIATVDGIVKHYVASLLVGDIRRLDIEGLRPDVVATPRADTPGHASMPQLDVRLRDGNPRVYRLLAQKLAEMASSAIVLGPHT